MKKKRTKKEDEKERKIINVKGRAKHKQKKKARHKIKQIKRHMGKGKRTSVHHYRKHSKPIKRKIKKHHKKHYKSKIKHRKIHRNIKQKNLSTEMLSLNAEDLKKSSHIFRSYDVRGIYNKDLNEEIMYRIGNTFAAKTKKNIVVGIDVRTSSPALCNSFISGCIAAGKKVYFIGLVPLGAGMLYALQKKFDYAFITASHLPKEWNGVKFFHHDGIGYLQKENQSIKNVFLKGNLSRKSGGKAIKENNKKTLSNYIDFFKIKAKKKMKIILDPGNGCASLAARKMFEKADFDVISIYDYIDGNFPNRDPEPTSENLTTLKEMIIAEKADFGFAYDGDGDRFILVDNKARVSSPEQASYIILQDLLNEKKGPVVANIECTRLVDDIASRFSRKVIRVPVGHTFLVQTVLKEKACFGFEASGHFMMPSLIKTDDSLAVSLHLAVQLSKQYETVSDLLDKIPSYPFARINFECSDQNKFNVIENLKEELKEKHKGITSIDGIRIEFSYGWILIRASNTSPAIRLSIEAQNDYYLDKMKNEFSEILEGAIKEV